jgi:hypothetical protein
MNLIVERVLESPSRRICKEMSAAGDETHGQTRVAERQSRHTMVY